MSAKKNGAVKKRPSTKRSGRKPQSKRRITPVLAVFAGLLVLVAALGLYVFGPGPAAPAGKVTPVTVERGQGLNAIARKLEDAGVIRSATIFKVAARLSTQPKGLRAGTYEFPSRLPMIGVLNHLLEGRVVQHFVTIPEGRTSAQAVRILMATEGLTGDVAVPPEGAILPETYQYEPGESRQAVLDRMLSAQRKLMDELWMQRAIDLPVKTKEEALILASVVEKETGIASERPQVAAVFVNRMRLGMRLQSDPTVVYGVSKGEPLGRGLRRSELDAHTPWNTYQIDGLPITPIANPGKAALMAVLNPPQTSDLYFVADGTGGHVFAKTYDQHLENVARWRAIESSGVAIPVTRNDTIMVEP
ncbi:MAG: endolytic transglycosylase MltG [Asticcacaulis sp.]